MKTTTCRSERRGPPGSRPLTALGLLTLLTITGCDLLAPGGVQDGDWSFDGGPGFTGTFVVQGGDPYRISTLWLTWDGFQCGPATLQASGQFTGREIVDRTLDLDLTVTDGAEIRILGEFGIGGAAADGSWTATIDGESCSGSWTAEPV